MKRLTLPLRHAELVSASILPIRLKCLADRWTLKQVQGDGFVQSDGLWLEFKV